VKRLLFALPLVLQLSGTAGLVALVYAAPEELPCCCCCAKSTGGNTHTPDVRPPCPCKMAPRDPAAPSSTPSATLEPRESRASTPAVAPALCVGHLLPTFSFGDRAPIVTDPSPPHLRTALLRC
jgi:hypothetical protein